MYTKDAIKYFGGRPALARVLGIKPPSIYQWGKRVPPLRQLQLERLTNGELVAQRSILPERRLQQR